MTTKAAKARTRKPNTGSSKKRSQTVEEYQEEARTRLDAKEKRRAEMLGSLDEFVDWLGDVEPGERLEAIKCSARIAKRLCALAGSRLKIEFDPSLFIGGEKESSQGHQFVGHIDFDGDESFFFIDGRKGSLGKQLIRELHRVGKIYTDLAKEVKAKMAANGVHRSLVAPTAPLPPAAMPSSDSAETSQPPSATKRAIGSKKSRAK
jgi:hypothetical protein